MNRAYSVLTVEAVDEDKRIITGIATTPDTDRMGDIVEPMGVKFSNPLPLLWQHMHDKPVGTVKLKRPTRKGIEFEAKLADVSEPGSLKDRVDEAWQSVKAGLVRGVSIGFRTLKHAVMENGGWHFLETEVYELSLVTIPANASATIQTIKSFDAQHMAASGRASGVRRVRRNLTSSGVTKMDIATTVAELETRRDELVTEIKGFGDVTDLDAEQAEDFDNLTKELDDVEKSLSRAQRMERLAGTAKEVSTDSRAKAFRPTVPAKPKVEVEKGIRFARYVIAMARAKGDHVLAFEHAKQWKDHTPEVGQFIKAVAGTAIGGSGTWGSELVDPITREFQELLMPNTVIGRIQGLDYMPFNTRIIEQTEGGLVGWVGEGDQKPVGEMAFGEILLPYHKAAGIVVLSDELVRLSTPSAEQRVRDQLVRDMAAFLDDQFLDSTITANDDRPAAITNGATDEDATGTDGAALRADLFAGLSTFRAANIRGPFVFIMPDVTALGIGLLTNELGQTEFSGINADGGTLLGYPVITSNSAPAGQITILAPSQIAVADDGMTTIDASREATLNMLAPTGDSATYSLWQRNAVGIRAERWITWKRKRAAAVYLIENAAYGPMTAS